MQLGAEILDKMGRDLIAGDAERIAADVQVDRLQFFDESDIFVVFAEKTAQAIVIAEIDFF
jgi:hypothetical protein